MNCWIKELQKGDQRLRRRMTRRRMTRSEREERLRGEEADESSRGER